MAEMGRDLPVSVSLLLGSWLAGRGQIGRRSRSFRLARAGQLVGNWHQFAQVPAEDVGTLQAFK